MFALRDVHQIEMTSHCNLRCRYCTHPHMPRPKLHMSEEHYRRALRWVTYFRQVGTQGELNLAGIGESTMHPEFVRFVGLAREAVGPDHPILFATNGLLMTDELARAIAPYKPRVWVSLHRPERAGPAIQALRRVGLLVGVSTDPSTSAINWAGQVDWEVSAQTEGSQCDWIKRGWAFVMADGRVSHCCLDATGEGVFGHVNDDLARLKTRPFILCRTCHLDVGVPIPDDVPRRDNVVPLKFVKPERRAS